MSDRLTIEQLAAATGMTVRNIRNHQSRGLLPPPEVVSRIGYYGPEHVERLQLIRDMQADGFNLEAIRRLLQEGGGSGPLMGLRRVIANPEEETPEILTAEELVERFGPMDPKLTQRAANLEFLLPLGDGRFEAPSPQLLRAAEQVIGRGVPVGAALHTLERVKRETDAIARSLVKLFLDELWKPVRDGGEAEERWPEVAESIERLRPIASDVVLALFRQALVGEVERAFAREVTRLSKGR